MNYWLKTSEQVKEDLSSDLENGLSQEQVKERLIKYGPNELPQKSRANWIKLLLGQFSSIIIWLLIIAAGIAAFLGEVVDAWAILAIVILNAILGFFQEYRAERSLEALQKLATPMAKVIRGGVQQTMEARELVPGDLVLLEAGDRVPGDGRIVRSISMQTDEAMLTGESIPVAKISEAILQEKLALGDQKNMAFMGTVVVTGKGAMIVTNTGTRTEIGKIALYLKEEKKEQTPLQKQLDVLGKKLVVICLGIVIIVFVLGIIRGSSVINMLLISLSLAVAAIPEGLPAAVTISLSIGLRIMAEKKALIRRLSSVETLGSTTVICTDKTGTLTQSIMSVRHIWVDRQIITISGEGYAPEGDFFIQERKMQPSEVKDLSLALKIGALCNSAELRQEDHWKISGDPTEAALLTVAGKAGFKKGDLQKEFIQINEIPFDSDRKMMSVLRKSQDQTFLFVKGAPDILLKHSNRILLDDIEQNLTEELRKEIAQANDQFAEHAYRVLGVAYRKNPEEMKEENLVFVGLFAMKDPPRPEVIEAISICKRAGMRPIMMTGDHKKTAIAIAKELDMLPEGEHAIDGEQLEAMSDEELEKELDSIAIYARITAEHKFRIVNLLKKKQEVTAMTGDGVNDAPAIQAADIGIAMGITGSDVTKEASDMIILDDNFASIVRAVEQGRGIYDNIVKFVSYLLSSNIAEILVIFIVMLLGLKGDQGEPFVALLPIQLLWINLVTDGFPAISLAMDPVDKRVMDRPPRNPKQGILHRRFFFFIISISILVTLGAICACLFGLQKGTAAAQTMTFTILVVLELVRLHMIRRQYHLTFFSNPYLIGALASSFALQLIVLYIPSLQIVFGTVPLGWIEWGVILGISVVVFILGSFITKMFYKSE